MKLFLVCLLTLTLLSCGDQTYDPMEIYHPPESVEETTMPTPVYTDDLVPEDYDPMKDSLFLPFGTDGNLYEVNPYSLRTSPLWESNADYCVLTDLNNLNPVKIPVYNEPVDDVEGYTIATAENSPSHRWMRVLLYTGDQYPPHVYENTNVSFAFLEHGIAMTYEEESQSLRTMDLRTGETTPLLEYVALPDDAWQIRMITVVAGKYVIYEVLSQPEPMNTVGYPMYYMRVDVNTGEVGFIVP